MTDEPEQEAKREECVEYLTATEVAKILRISQPALYRLASEGSIPCRRIGRRVIFPREVVMDKNLNFPIPDSLRYRKPESKE